MYYAYKKCDIEWITVMLLTQACDYMWGAINKTTNKEDTEVVLGNLPLLPVCHALCVFIKAGLHVGGVNGWKALLYVPHTSLSCPETLRVSSESQGKTGGRVRVNPGLNVCSNASRVKVQLNRSAQWNMFLLKTLNEMWFKMVPVVNWVTFWTHIYFEAGKMFERAVPSIGAEQKGIKFNVLRAFENHCVFWRVRNRRVIPGP